MSDPFSDAYSFLAPNPNTEYGTYLPIARDTQTGANRFAMPEMMRSALQGLVGMGQSTQTGSLTPEALASLTLGSMGAGFMGAPRGALAAGGSRIMPPDVRSQYRDLHPPDNDNLSRQQYQAMLDWAASRKGEPAFADVVNNAMYQGAKDEQWRQGLAAPKPVGFRVPPRQTDY